VRQVLRDLQVVEKVIFLVRHPRKAGVQRFDEAAADTENEADRDDSRRPSI
jgi:hypothetical protein